MRHERDFLTTLRAFFAPVRQLPKEYLKIGTRTLIKAIYPIATIWVIDQVLGFIATQQYEQAQYRAIGYAIYVILYNVFLLTISLYRDQDFQFYTRKTLNAVYMQKFLQLDTNTVERIGTGKLIAILDNGLTKRRELLRSSFRHGIENSVTIVLSLVYIGFTIGYHIIWILVLLACLVVFVKAMNKRAISRRRKRRDQRHEHTKHAVKIIMSKTEILQADKGDYEIKNLNRILENVRLLHRKVVWYVSLFFRIPILWVSLGIGMALYLAAQPQSLHFADIGGVAGVLMILHHLGTVLNAGIKFFRDFTKDIVHVEKILDLFDQTPAMSGYHEGDNFSYQRGDISLQDVSFAYHSGSATAATPDVIFSNFTLDITGGKKTGIVGVSGAGKSTLVKLIAGYLRPDQGAVLVDGQDLTQVSLKSYYQDIGYLTQEPSIFDGTIIDNLSYAIDGEIDPSELKRCLSLAKCDFVWDFATGVETEIGERGIRLSGGQRQRLAIAKIFLKNPNIIILDEPTSSLDSFGEEAITEAMNNLFENRTVIIIAHRLQTVKRADDIIVLHEGQVIERGTHTALVEQGGHYARMLELQSGF